MLSLAPLAGSGLRPPCASARSVRTSSSLDGTADKGNAALTRLRMAVPGVAAEMHYADLSQPDEVRRLGATLLDAVPRLDVLVNNAGAIFGDRNVAPDGLELTFALNHMGYFRLTALLRERLIASAPARVVNVASEAHRGSHLDFEDLQCSRHYSGWTAYKRSKLANILFTRELARRFEGTGVTANCLHPGFVATSFGDNNHEILALGHCNRQADRRHLCRARRRNAGLPRFLSRRRRDQREVLQSLSRAPARCAC